MLYLYKVGVMMVNKKKTVKEKREKIVKKNNDIDKRNSLIFGALLLGLLIVVIVVSCLVEPKTKNINSNSFKNISFIGIGEMEASLNYSGQSIFFICHIKEQKCNDELNILDELVEKYGLYIEFINAYELVDTEEARLLEIIGGKDIYPRLIVMNNGEITINKSEYLNKKELINLFEKIGVITK